MPIGLRIEGNAFKSLEKFYIIFSAISSMVEIL